MQVRLGTVLLMLFLLPEFCALRYVESKKDRVTVVFSTVFKDDDDVVIGKVFMQVRSKNLEGKLCCRKFNLHILCTQPPDGLDLKLSGRALHCLICIRSQVCLHCLGNW